MRVLDDAVQSKQKHYQNGMPVAQMLSQLKCTTRRVCNSRVSKDHCVAQMVESIPRCKVAPTGYRIENPVGIVGELVLQGT